MADGQKPDSAGQAGLQGETVGLAEAEFSAIVDTNVLLEIFSCHDLSALYAQLGEGEAGSLHPRAIYRRARTRDSLLLAMHLNQLSARTFSAYEARTIMVARVDPAAVDTFENHYTTIVVHYVKDYLLPHWRALAQNEDDHLHGTAVDASLVALARERQIPLITNEGFTEAGVLETGLRKRGKDAGVVVLTPRAFFEGRLDEDLAAHAFVDAFRRHANRYLETHHRRDVVLDSMKWMSGYYRHVLFGETAEPGMVVPVRMQLPP